MITVSLRPVPSRANVRGTAAAGAIAMMLLATAPASAAPSPTSLVSACSGVRLQGAAISNFLAPLVTNGVVPIQNDVNALLAVTSVLPGGGVLPATPLSFNGVGFLNNLTSGGDINLAVIKQDGTLFGPADTCNTTADSFQLNTPVGISLGGNQITGLGNGTVATAGEINSIALGNGATTAASATNSIAVGTGAAVAAGAAGGVAVGNNAGALAAGAIAVGQNARANNGAAVAIGQAATSISTTGAANYGIAIGGNANANSSAPGGSSPIAIGINSHANGTGSQVAIGDQAVATGTDSIAIGGHAFSAGVAATGNEATAIGQSAMAAGDHSLALGYTATVNAGATDSIAAGNASVVGAGATSSIAFGTNATVAANAANGLALGTGATVSYANGVAIGQGSATSLTGPTGTGFLTGQAAPAGEVSIGSGALIRRVTNVADGSAPTDAVTVAQLMAENAGRNAIGTSVATNLGAGATYDPATGTVSPPAFAVQGTTYNNVGAAIGALDGATTVNTTAITNLGNGTAGTVQRSPGAANGLVLTATGGTGAAPGAAQTLGNVAAGVAPTDAVNLGQVGGLIGTAAAAAPIQYANAAAPTTPTPGVVSNDTTLVGTTAGTPVTLHNVAPGSLAAGSTDAVNGGQLAATNANVTNNTTAITNLSNGTAGLVLQATPTSTVTVAAATGGTTVDFTGTGGTRTLTGVTAGVNPTDAVNVGQLNTTNANVATTTTNLTNLTNGINAGTVGLVQQVGGSPGAGMITVGAATGGTTISIAGTDGTRTLTGITAGVAPTDAVNVSQLAGTVGAATANAVQYDTAGGVRQNSVTLAGGAAGPVTVTNVAPGALTPTSTDAVNGSQLAATNANVTTNTTNIAGNTAAITNLNNGTAGTVQQTGAPNGLALVAPGGTGAAPGAPQTLSNVAAGVAPTDAVNLGQVGTLIGTSAAASPIQYANAAAPTTPTPGVVSNDTTLVGTTPGSAVALHNVAAGALAPTSTDAVNGSQLAATNFQVATNTTNIAGNTTAITNLTNGTAGLVQQTGGAPGTGQITVGAATGGTSVTIAGTGGNRTLTGLANGLAGNDAVTVAQINGLTGNGLDNVQYDPSGTGGRSNTITLAGGAPGTVLVTNVSPGTLSGTSTDAVNGSQLYATNAMVATLTSGQAGAFQSNNAGAAPPPVATGANASAGGFGASATGAGGVALGNGATSTGVGSVAIGQGSTDGGQAGVVSVGGVGSERRITNVGPALNATDAVNLAQLQATTNSFTATTNGLQNEINQTNFDLNQVRRRANGGTAGAMAVAGLPQAFEPGRSMIGGAVGYWADQVAFAVGISTIVGEHTVVKAGGSISNQGVGGFNAGVGYQF